MVVTNVGGSVSCTCRKRCDLFSLCFSTLKDKPPFHRVQHGSPSGGSDVATCTCSYRLEDSHVKLVWALCSDGCNTKFIRWSRRWSRFLMKMIQRGAKRSGNLLACCML